VKATGLRARNVAAFQAERARIASVVEAIWKRDQWMCRNCHQPVTKTGTSPKKTGYVRFTNPLYPTIETGRLFCGVHFHGAAKIRAPRFVRAL